MFNRIVLISLITLTLSYATEEFSSERILGIEVGYSTLNTNKNRLFSNKNIVITKYPIGEAKNIYNSFFIIIINLIQLICPYSKPKV